MATRRRQTRKTETTRSYAYQVRLNYMRVFRSDPVSDLGFRAWDEQVRLHMRQGINPMDAARGIHATEVKK